jgi:hypothetical protein
MGEAERAGGDAGKAKVDYFDQIDSHASRTGLGSGMEFYEHIPLVRCGASLEIVFPSSFQEFRAALPFLVVPSWLEMAEDGKAPIMRTVRLQSFSFRVVVRAN